MHGFRRTRALSFVLSVVSIGAVLGCSTPATKPEDSVVPEQVVQPTPPVQPSPPPEIFIAPPKIALVLGGGAARGFAHVGVIKMLEAQGIKADLVVGTSAGSVVGSLYAAGYDGFELQRLALELDEKSVSDWILPNRGFLRGEALQNYVNTAVKNRPLEQLNKPIGVIATDLKSGEQVVFRRGNTGMAVRASSSVPGVFQPVTIGGREFVDGGLTSPVPVRAARDMGADIVIAVDISKDPSIATLSGTLEVLLQTFTIMGRSIAAQELLGADVVISPDTHEMRSASFDARHVSIIEGEKAALAAVPKLRQKIVEREERLRKAALAAQQPAR
ncbi:MAG: patatin-like phospholipase family protein [Burkholderiales bacterium]|nr:patatin-like phospholipase family protein [Burkholderiales bacterium]